jgi:polyhydroxybutyrate depolymerase
MSLNLKLSIIILLLFISCSKTDDSQPIIVLDQFEFKDTIMHNGIERSYVIHFPPTYNGIDKLPLVMALHGGGEGDGQDLLDKNHFDEVGDTENYISLFPNGVFSDWADGRGVTDSELAGIDDVSFLSDLIDHLIQKYQLNTNKVYVCGASNGGMMTQRLACEIPQKFAAFGSIIASMPNEVFDSCNPQEPVSMLLMNGTDDTFVPYDGGDLGPLTDGGSVIGTDETILFWQNNNLCTNFTPTITDLPNIDNTDNSTVTVFDYGSCTSSSEILLYRINDGGHILPGFEANINPVPLVGYINYDIDAAEEIWKFFEKHSR